MDSADGLRRIALILVVLALTAGCEIRPLDPETGRAIIEEDAERFDADTYVDATWSEEIVPAFRADAVDVDSLLMRLENMDPEERAEIDVEARAVRGTGRVLSLDDASQARLLHVDAPPYDGDQDYALQIGPVIRGTALRDAVPAISFDQFVNQLEYAGVARSLNDRLVESVLSDLNPEDLVGSEIYFVGVLPLRNLEMRMITPIEIHRSDA